MDGHLAGFALINEHANLEGTDHALAEFFVVRRYRRCGVGRAAAAAVFERLSGVWEVPVSAANKVGQAFWRSVIGAYTGSEPEPRREAEWDGSIFQFTSAPGAKPGD